MTEEIKTRQTTEDASGVESVSKTTDGTGALPTSRDEKKSLISWAALLDEAVKKPGFIHEAYSRFHNYSLGNRLLALFQCFERGIQPGPLATWPKWNSLGRNVNKCEKALTLCMPVTCKHTKTVTKEDGNEQDEEFAFTHFTCKPHWFVLGQTEGEEYKPAAISGWNEQKALEALNIQRIEFENLNGNAQGYARREVCLPFWGGLWSP
ncbi:MAG TPA: ArdC-like ssDNA-binding domain-containing protein [Terriglobia bacterium]|nr:ArdC-like ssDNA-binding domain-containing protein [Terriglobia bacterium]